MGVHKNKIITVVVVVAVLAAAWIFGGSYGNTGGVDSTSAPLVGEAGTPAPGGGSASSTGGSAALATEETMTGGDAVDTENSNNTPVKGSDGVSASGSSSSEDISKALPSGSSLSEGGSGTLQSGSSPSEVGSNALISKSPSSCEVSPTSGKDIYLTDAVPEGKPLPVEPQDSAAGDGSFTITLSVRCDTILANMSMLNKNKHELVPADGKIFPATEVTAYEGENVFNVLRREMKRNKIHMEFMNTPIYNSAYIEGINNLYEFDVGELSGWMYKVNDWFPNYGCSRYQVKAGDVVEWVYTCDLGKDVGGDGAIGGAGGDL